MKTVCGCGGEDRGRNSGKGGERTLQKKGRLAEIPKGRERNGSPGNQGTKLGSSREEDGEHALIEPTIRIGDGGEMDRINRVLFPIKKGTLRGGDGFRVGEKERGVGQE